MESIQQILKNSKNIAIVGLSDNPERPSYVVATYLLEHGYTIFPVNPNLSEWKGIKAYASLSEIQQKIDIVDIFRKSEDVLPIVEEVLLMNKKPKTIWMQLGVINEKAADLAATAGLTVIVDKCIKIEHARLKGG